ncbi:MgtC/SapB family protein [Paraburkholderia caballeronis]|uniref:MgtC/SapB family protein n=1 Tax=Paraburkholderia caballeronis TaxID=416943 RepID=UPI001065F9B9|nr:MgtC/SapB family protein [Paraburkholderia caballeronis]TDV21049.1 putative Mg2+ transporter-C (MgtC) family protein [Paraburkholderia caballeronis]TDV21478.1 putative Mg2+ transporter-C (MgtC) family protein [Paraburkholderia caballeronis]TDV33517.1 putative Mg2+ transporter-C (MgtC) family protein [Paraburkholderia caballeronis]
MDPMPLDPTWPDFALRLAIAAVAGTLIGLNRGESGNAAGLRTTLLVCLAACIAMMQVNVLLTQHGKPADSFVSLDLMRLPLGILSGVGFIGAGSILHREGLVRGVTTAATMWFVTVIGLCAGGGQYALAIAGTVLGLVVLRTFSRVERWLPRGRRVSLTIVHRAGADPRDALAARLALSLKPHGCRIAQRGLTRAADDARVEERFEVRWRAKPDDERVERELSRLVTEAGEAAAWSVER